jgi:hypothetical protein
MPRASSAYEVFLVFENAAVDAELLCETASALQTNTATARLLGVDLYYRADRDVMMLGLRFDPHAATGALLERVREDADRTGASMLELPRLADEDRRKFMNDYVPHFPLCVRGLPTPGDAVTLFARDLGHAAEFGDSRTSGRGVPRGTGPGTEAGRPRLEVHFARGDGWQLGRARNLTREGVYIIAAATPRQGDIVDVKLSSGELCVILRGQVVYVTPEQATEALGAAGFGVRFLLANGEDRQKLEKLVQLTLGEGYASIRPAPPRRDVRYPVRWPVTLDLGHACASLAALDVSARGMFVACNAPALPRTVDVSFEIDDPGAPIQATARVARAVPAEVARLRGVAVGYGLEIVSLTQSDDARFKMFVARVGRRAEKSIIVAAAPTRANQLAAELSAAGYAALSVSEPDLVVQRASVPRPPDLVIVDDSLERQSSIAVRQMRRALTKIDVQVSFLDGQEDVAGHVRALADAALLD